MSQPNSRERSSNVRNATFQNMLSFWLQKKEWTVNRLPINPSIKIGQGTALRLLYVIPNYVDEYFSEIS